MAKVVGDLRQRRKVEHVAAVRALGDNPASTNWFEDVSLVPCCAPELAVDEVSIASEVCGVTLPSPIVVNAMTGGADEVYEINRKLAAAARRHGLAMALGSGTAGVRSPEVAYTYSVVREVYPDGVVIANVGMGTDVETAKAAVDIVGAQLLQVHWNVAQEMFMTEGDRDFRGALAKLVDVVQGVGVPVIAKEVGQGIAAEQAVQFVECGVRGIDVGGRGGTNFIAVEAWRRGLQLADSWQNWGLSTAASLAEVMDAVGDRADVFASGGMRTADEIVKAMAMGAKAVGIAGPLVRLLGQPDGEAALDRYLEELHAGLRTLLVLTGCRTWADLRKKPVVVTGKLREWLAARGRQAYVTSLQQRGGIAIVGDM